MHDKWQFLPSLRYFPNFLQTVREDRSLAIFVPEPLVGSHGPRSLQSFWGLLLPLFQTKRLMGGCVELESGEVG